MPAREDIMTKILLVEDDEHIRLMLTMVFENNFTVLEADDYYSAVKLFDEQKPDLVITDLSMSPLTGLDLVRKIRETDSKVPIIAWSGAVQQSKQEEIL